MIIKVKNWEKYQSYNPKRPSDGKQWKKMHVDFFEDFHVRKLTEVYRYKLLGIYAFTDLATGTLDICEDELCYRLGCKSIDLSMLHDFIDVHDSDCMQVDNNLITSCMQVDNNLSARTEENRIEQNRSDQNRVNATDGNINCAQKNKPIKFEDIFDQFWESYPRECPRKVDKPKCKKALKKILQSGTDYDTVILGIEGAKNSDQWQQDGGQFIPAPLTWLNREGWLDEYGTRKDLSETNNTKGTAL